MLSISSPFMCSMPRITHQSLLNVRSKREIACQRTYLSSRVNFYQACLANGLPGYKAPMLHVACRARGLQSEDGDHRALETVLKLCKAIKNKNFNELSDMFGEECLCICNFVSTTFQPFHGKEQVLAFFSSLMKNLGNNIEFIVQPTFHQGMNVGVSWKLEWSKTHVPLGKGFGFYMCHIYQGKVLINNVDMFLEPILHIEPLRLKTITSLTRAADNICSRALFQGKAKRAVKIFFTILVVAAALFYLRQYLF
ncbi:hypothetical protein ACH5RR_017525 [Cinchona calisaya]|uniref:SnoaL-like domain-containing protein n=1 Tax=Cinchona calisaya TaxID=153742 RepID=A0ABD2ZIX7_9GENT